MDDVPVHLLVDILCELTQIKIVLTSDFDPNEVAYLAGEIINSKRYLSSVIKSYEIKEV